MKKLLVVLLSLVAVITFFSCNNTPVVEQVEEPVFLTEEGAIKSGDSVELSCNTAGATIYYTTSKITTPQEYKGKITVSEAMTISAYATKSGWKDSGVVTASYTIMPELKLTFTVNNKAVDEGTTLYLIDAEVGIGFECSPTDVVPKIYYTTNGEEPTEDSTLYKGTFFIDKEMTIKACAIAEDCVEGKATLNFALKGESPKVKYEIIPLPGEKVKPVLNKKLHLCTVYEKSDDKISIKYLKDGEGNPANGGEPYEYRDDFELEENTKYYTVWAEKDGCKPGPEKNITCGPDKIYMGDDGCIHVHFGEPQPVKVSTASVGSETYVEYATCESAFPVLKDLPSVTSTFRNFVKMLALVSNKYEEDESDLYKDYDYVAQDFILSLSAEGSVLDLLRSLMENIFGGVITVQLSDDSLIVASTEGMVLVNIPISKIKLSGVIPFSPSNWDGLAISPIYITKDFYGLLIDILQKNLYIDFLWKKGVESTDTPLTGFAILKEDGKTAIVAKDFPKASAKLQYYYDENTGDVIFAQEFYSANNLSDRSKFAQETGITVVTQPGDKLTTSTNYRCTTLTDKDTDLIYFYNLAKSRGKTYFVRQSYGIDVVSPDNKYIVKRTEILTTITDEELTSKSDCYVTDTDRKPAKFVEMDKNTIKTPLEEGISYFVCLNKYLNGKDNAQSADLFYVNSNNCKYTLSLKDKLDKVLLVIASGKDNITGFYNRYESKKI